MTDGWTGAKATALRKALRLTVDGFARKLDMSPRGVAHWRANPEVVPRIAQWDRLDELLREADPAAKKRFEELTGHTARESATHSIGRDATSPTDVLDLFDEIDNIYAKAAWTREEPEEEWTLPPGAKPIDCVAFGEMDRVIRDLVSRVVVLERRLSFVADKLLDTEAGR